MTQLKLSRIDRSGNRPSSTNGISLEHSYHGRNLDNLSLRMSCTSTLVTHCLVVLLVGIEAYQSCSIKVAGSRGQIKSPIEAVTLFQTL
jgi:hypothetical protein